MKKQTLLFYFLFYNLLSCVKADRYQKNQEFDYSKTASLNDYNNRALLMAGKATMNQKQFNLSGKSEWKGPNRSDFWFEVCKLADRASQGFITGQKFYIKSELGYVTSDDKGSLEFKVTQNNCLEWRLGDLPFDYFAKSVNLVLHYEIESVSGNMGKIVRRIGINPWDVYRDSSRSTAFMDLTNLDKKDWPKGEWVTGEKDILSAMRGDLFKTDTALQLRSVRVEPKQREQQPQKPTLKNNPDPLVSEDLKDLIAEAEERNFREQFNRQIIGDHGESQNQDRVVGGINTVITLSAQPFVRLKDSTGVPKDDDLLTGRFMIFANLIASGAHGNNKKYLLSRDVQSITKEDRGFTWNLNENGLQVNIPLVLKYQSSFGRVELLLKVIPISSDLRNIKPFTAVYDLGQWNEWVRNQAPMFKEEAYNILKDIDYKSYLSALDIIEPELKTIRTADDFIFGAFTIRFVRIMPGETATDRTLQYSVKTCIVSGLDGTPVSHGLQFEIKTEDDYGGNQTDNSRIYKIRRATDNEGCLTWFGFLSHKYYRKEVLKKKTATVSYVGGYDCEEENNENCQIEKRGHIDFRNREFSYYMNPWDEKWTFGWDARDMLTDYLEDIRKQMKEAPDSKLFISEVKYETMGFRYAVDKFLNLKVRKTVLLSFHPYVLKYNSIRLGRGATEKLRDGVYLMKVALQKDYLDPSAKGVKIYDKGLSPKETGKTHTDYETYIRDRQINLEGELGEEEMNHLRVQDLQELSPDDEQSPVIDNSLSRPIAENKEGKEIRFYKDEDGNTYRAANGQLSPQDRALDDSKKQYISIQQKLVRVIGGRIITPIEFEISDLRLMRIRNQFFIQLETIDENKLKLATMFNTLLNRPGGEIRNTVEEAFKEAYRLIDSHIGDFKHEEVKEHIDKVSRLLNLSQQNSLLKEMETEDEIKRLRDQVYSLFGLTSEDSNEDKKLALQSFSKILHYRLNGLNPNDAIENRNAEIIDNIIRQDSSHGREYITDEIRKRENSKRNNKVSELSEKYLFEAERRVDDRINKSDELQNNINRDPWQKFMFPSDKDWKTELKEFLDFQIHHHESNEEDRRFLEKLRNDFENVDFTTSPLTPVFSLDLLSNEGIHPQYDSDGTPLPDNGSSGLPSRTFVGPITYLLNHNSLHLRPTDVLNEKFCQTATCSVPDEIEQILYHRGMNRIFTDQDPGPLRRKEGSANENYERSNYYGFLAAYHNMSVDKLIEMEKGIKKKQLREMELGSQPVNFVRAMNLKYMSLYNGDENTGLKEINSETCEEKEPHEIQDCLSPLNPDSGLLIKKETFYKQLNDRYYYQNDLEFATDPHSSLPLKYNMEELINPTPLLNPFCHDEESGKYQLCQYSGQHNNYNYNYNYNLSVFSLNGEFKNSEFYYLKDTKFEDSDLEKIITNTKNNENHDPRLNRDFMHRMCFVLTQNLFEEQSFIERRENKNEEPFPSQPFEESEKTTETPLGFLAFVIKKHTVLQEVEKDCHHFLSNLYDYPKNFFGNWKIEDIKEKNDWNQARPDLVRFSPIILERKARVFKTTGRYVYKGGKSLNVNVSTSFNIRSSKGFSISSRMAYKPYAWFKNITVWVAGGAIIGSGFAGIGAAPGALLGALGGIVSATLDGFDVSRASTIDERQVRNSGTTVSSGTFLVTQQANLDIELGEYERCLVVRFHPNFLRLIWKKHLLGEKIDFHNENISVEKEKNDFKSLGIMVCTGKKERKCLPVREKYFYFTQHFTDGDMLDVGDLHNHPWMLQLRGLRDYMAFTSLIGAREVEVDQNDWFNTILNETYKDTLAFTLSGSEKENMAGRFNLVKKDSDINWTLNELSHVYFNVLPTFPGIYTFIEGDQSKRQKTEWPWKNSDPNYLLNTTSPDNQRQNPIDCVL